MSAEPSDDVFRFYWSDHEEMEYAGGGPFDTVEQARAHALEQFETKSHGSEPGDTIYIVRCDKRLTVAPDFSRLTEIILEAFGEKNEDCFSEDGFEGLVNAPGVTSTQAEAELEKALTYAFEAWQMKHRANIKTWCFGRVEDVEQFVLPDFGSDAANEDFIHARTAKSMGMELETYRAALAARPTL